MGTSTFAEYTAMPEIALAKVDRDAPLDRACLFACGLSTGLGAAMNREGAARLDVRRLRRGHGRAGRRRWSRRAWGGGSRRRARSPAKGETLDVDPFVSHTLSLDEVDRGFELPAAQAGIRSVIALS